MALRVYKKIEHPKRRKAAQVISYASLVFGTLMLFWAFYPIVSFEVFNKLQLGAVRNSPLVPSDPSSALNLTNSIDTNVYAFSGNMRDFTHASEWFPLSTTSKQTQKTRLLTTTSTSQIETIPALITEGDSNAQNKPISSYSLSIPRLNIDSANVLLGGDDLSKSLIHFLPVSLPGENGNVVVFGHSTLPQFYNTTDYKTIFTYLPSLAIGDRIITSVENANYEYEVYDMFVVKPDQVSVLDQQYDDSYITLITCVPPGTYWNRLIVKARLTQRPSAL